MSVPLLFFVAALTGLTGQWHATATLGPQQLDFTFDLIQTGQQITGSATFRDNVSAIRDGAIHDAAIAFTVLIPSGGKLLPVTFSGTLEGAILHLTFSGVQLTATRVQPTAEAIRMERLAGLFRLWGAIQFFHPFVAHGAVDWDAALIAAMPKIDDYKAAVDGMLATLSDSETHTGAPLSAPLSAPMTPAKRRRILRTGLPPASDYYAGWEPVDSAAPYVMQLPEQLLVTVRTSEPITADTAIASSETRYDSALPSREGRLLALARLWNTIHYFYGYANDLPDWDAALLEFIPVFEAADTEQSYLTAIARLAAHTHDFHTGVPAAWPGAGNAPEIAISPMEGRTVVTAAGPGATGIAPGDIILSVDGETVEHRIQSLLGLIPHSTPQNGLLMAHRHLLEGNGSTIRLRVEKPGGAQVEITAERGKPLDWQHTNRSYPVIVRSTPVVGILPEGAGYIDLTRLAPEDLDRAFDAVRTAPALILDIRGGPLTPFDAVPARLIEKQAAAALIRRKIWHGPDPTLAEVRTATQTLSPSGRAKYPGRVVVLIDARAISHAEQECLFLEAANVTFIGSPTTGADGDVTSTVLPGGITVNFAGKEIRHIDGRPLQRVGILPDIWAEPTISGFRQGRDEVLERAVLFLKTLR